MKEMKTLQIEKRGFICCRLSGKRRGEGYIEENTFVFVNTHNKVVEQVTHKGTSSSKLLFDLVVRYKLLETRFGCRCFVSHVSGTRMIAQGTDGVQTNPHI